MLGGFRFFWGNLGVFAGVWVLAGGGIFFGDGGGGLNLGEFVILSIAKYPKNLRCTLILWILRFLTKAQYDNFIDMTKFRRLFEF